jgi:hypothetical protein
MSIVLLRRREYVPSSLMDEMGGGGRGEKIVVEVLGESVDVEHTFVVLRLDFSSAAVMYWTDVAIHVGGASRPTFLLAAPQWWQNSRLSTNQASSLHPCMPSQQGHKMLSDGLR